MIIFPTIHIGEAELNSILESMQKANILDQIFVIYTNEFSKSNILVAKNHICDDFKSMPELLKKIETWRKKNLACFMSIIGTDDEEQFKITQKIASKFNAKFYEPLIPTIATNKFLMKREFVKNNVPTGKFMLFDGSQDIREISFPNILKLVSGTGSSYIFLNTNELELRKNLEILKQSTKCDRKDHRLRKIIWQEGESLTINPKKEFLLEEYIGGDEYSCDLIKQGEKVDIIRVVKKMPSQHLGYFKGYHLMNESSIKKAGIGLGKLRTVCKNISKSLRIDNGICMVDFKLCNGQIKVIETSIRPGFSSFVNLMNKIYGYTSLSLLARMQLGEKIKVNIPKEEGFVLDRKSVV